MRERVFNIRSFAEPSLNGLRCLREVIPIQMAVGLRLADQREERMRFISD